MDEKCMRIKVKEVFSDAAFVKSLLAKESAEEIQAALKGRGMDLSIEETCKIRDLIVAGDNNGVELSDEQLEAVPGAIQYFFWTLPTAKPHP